MKFKLLFFLLIFISSQTSFSQDLIALDNKMGFMDIKIGQPISNLSAKINQDEKISNMYLIINPNEYYIEGHVIDKIIIIVSEDGKMIIENFTLMFVDKIEGLIEIVNDRNKNFEKRQEALKEAERLREQGFEYDFYHNLFKVAFGEPTEKKNQTETWKGKKINLICSKSTDYGLINFSKVNSPEYIKKKKIEQGKKATSKF